MCATLKSLKANVEKLVPFAAANSVDQFDAMQQSESKVEILSKSLRDTKAEHDRKMSNMDWNLHQFQNRNNFLEQELFKKTQEPKGLCQVMNSYLAMFHVVK